MIIGFTGTRRGMTLEQKAAFGRLLLDMQPVEFHHGDCVGADEEAANIAWDLGRRLLVEKSCRIICHPPVDESLRAFTKSAAETRPAKMHFARNRDIVDACDKLLACPAEMEQKLHGGTWYTIGYAKKKGKPVVVIWPDGSMRITAQTEERIAT